MCFIVANIYMEIFIFFKNVKSIDFTRERDRDSIVVLLKFLV